MASMRQCPILHILVPLFAALAVLAVFPAPCRCAAAVSPAVEEEPFDFRNVHFASQAPIGVVVRDKDVLVYRALDFKLLRTVQLPQQRDNYGKETTAISPDGQILGYPVHGAFALVDLRSGAVRLTIPNIDVGEVEFLPHRPGDKTDAPFLIALSTDDNNVTRLVILDAGGHVIRTLKVKLSSQPHRCFAISPDYKTVAGIEDGQSVLSFWDIRSGRRRYAIKSPVAILGPIAFAPNGKEVVSSVEDSTWPGPGTGPDGGAPSESSYQHFVRLQAWKVVNAKRLFNVRGNPYPLGDQNDIAFTCNGRCIVTSVDVFKFPSGHPRRLPSTSLPDIVAPDGRVGYRSDRTGSYRIDLTSWKVTPLHPIPPPTER